MVFMADHYAYAFTCSSTHCYRMVQENGTGHAEDCPQILGWRGRFQDRSGAIWNASA